MGNENIIIVDIWALAAVIGSTFGAGLYIIYRLLLYVSKLTIAGLRTEMTLCQTELLAEIELIEVSAKNAHRRISRLEKLLMAAGVKIITAKEKGGD